MSLQIYKKLKIVENLQTRAHPFHVMTNSKLPIVIATLVGSLALVFTAKLHTSDDLLSPTFNNAWLCFLLEPFFSVNGLNYSSINSLMLTIITALIIAMSAWGSNLIDESVMQGRHNSHVQRALRYGIILFLLSEAMLFFPFFLAFFHGSLSPSSDIGMVWPPKGISTLDPFMLPFVNTVVLLSSGIAIVSAHKAILAGYKTMVLNSMYIAISFGLLFSWLQFV